MVFVGAKRRATDGQHAKPPSAHAAHKPAAQHAAHKPAPHHPAHKPAHKPVPQQASTQHPVKKPAPHHAAHATHQAQGSNDHFHSSGAGQLKGSDTSHYQSGGTFEQSIKGAQWAAIKATEGTNYTDPSFKARWAELGKKIDQGTMKLRVAYLFLTKGNGVGQAKHFLSTLGIHGPLKPGTRLALDWEASALSSPNTLRDACNYVHQVTGIWPLVYTSGSQVSRAKAAAPNAPIWKAAWSSHIAKDAPFVQYSDGPGYDHDVFNGSLADLERFAGFRK